MIYFNQARVISLSTVGSSVTELAKMTTIDIHIYLVNLLKKKISNAIKVLNIYRR